MSSCHLYCPPPSVGYDPFLFAYTASLKKKKVEEEDTRRDIFTTSLDENICTQ